MWNWASKNLFWGNGPPAKYDPRAVPCLMDGWFRVKIMNFLLTWGDTLQVSVSCFPGCSSRLNKVLGCFYTAQHVKGNVRDSIVLSGKTVFHTLLLSNFHHLFIEKISHGCQIAGTVPNWKRTRQKISALSCPACSLSVVLIHRLFWIIVLNTTTFYTYYQIIHTLMPWNEILLVSDYY